MTYTERLARLVYYAIGLSIVGAILWVAWHVLAQAPSDPRTGTPGLAVETDAGTGCQYVVTPWGGIFARLGPDGKPMCNASGKSQ